MSCWQCDGGPRQVSTARSRWLGEELRAKRLQDGMSAEEAARRLEWSLHQLTGLELGEPGPDDIDIGRYLALFRATGKESRYFVYANREAGEDMWLQTFVGDPTLRVRTPAHEESRSTAITGYHPMMVPAPLRTTDYERAVHGLDQSPRRHDNLQRMDAVFFLDENVLARIAGDRAVMRDQIAHLLNCPAAIRIVPVDFPVECEGFAILDNLQEKPVVHLELLVANLFLENPEHVAIYRKAAGLLADVAWNVDTSRQFLQDWSDKYA